MKTKVVVSTTFVFRQCFVLDCKQVSTMTIRVPAILHDVFGERQSGGEIAAVLGVGLAVACALFLVFPTWTMELPWWRSLLAFLLCFDVAAGSVANFTRGTSDYYAQRPRHRWIFIAIHVHLPALAWLLSVYLWPAIAAWAYTIMGAAIVNWLHGHSQQVFVAAVLWVLGLALVIGFGGFPPPFLIIAVLFLTKVLYAFSVDHYRNDRGI